MLKFILIPFKLLVLFFIASYFTSGLSIVQEAPDRIDSLSSCTVNLKVNTKGVTGFAKFQHRFSEGVQIEPVELHGATFSFEKRQMKVIWMNLPEAEEFTISYKLTVTDPEIVEIPLGGTFSYLEENKRATYDIEQHIMKVGPDAETVKEQTRPRLTVNRSFESIGTDKYRVKLHVQGRYVTGFAKIEEVVPFDASSKSVENKDAVFSQVDNRVKFVWMNLPKTDTFSVVYEIDLSGAVSQNKEEIEGKFSYLYDNETQKVNIESGSRSEPQPDEEKPLLAEETAVDQPADDESSALVTDDESKEAPVEDAPEEEPVLTKKIEDEKPAENTETEKPAKVVSEESTTEEDSDDQPVDTDEQMDEKPGELDNQATDSAGQQIETNKNSDEGIEYRVQILAGKNAVKAPYFKSIYNFQDDFYVENHEGWIKYTTGGYLVYRQARDAREEIRSGYKFPGPFVVAYNDGLRVTVQEALMVTNQKWIK